MKRVLLIATAAKAVSHGARAEQLELTFVNHIKAGLPELDVYMPAPSDDALTLQIRHDRLEGRDRPDTLRRVAGDPA